MSLLHNYGWHKQKPDSRDFTIRHLGLVRKLPKVTPPSANLRRWCSEVADQGQLGSCTANAWAGLLEFNENRFPTTGSKYTDLSRLFIYYNERALSGSMDTDSGAELRDGAATLSKQGVCPESEWQYIISQFTIQPLAKCYTDALANVIHSYYALDGATGAETLANAKTCLASGQPFVFGFTVYESFESDVVTNTGVMPVPNTQTEQVLGGHAVMAIGYNDSEQRFLIRNSWGRSWGLPAPLYRGYFTMPYSVLADPNQVSDLWTVVKDH